MRLLEGRMEVWEAKGKGHCAVQKLPHFKLFSPLSPPQGHPTASAPTTEPGPGADLGVPSPRGPWRARPSWESREGTCQLRSPEGYSTLHSISVYSRHRGDGGSPGVSVPFCFRAGCKTHSNRPGNGFPSFNTRCVQSKSPQKAEIP